ncbi:MAG: branched-chain amino acid ABC transporter permease [Nitrososphaerales archaeon]
MLYKLVFGFVDIAQAIVDGFLNGGFYALAAVGLSLIFGVQRILNVAHGAFVVLASFVTIQFSLIVTPQYHLDPLLSLILDFVVMSVFGIGVYFILIYKIEKTGFEAPLLATFGLSIFLEYVIQYGLGPIHPLDPSGGIGAQAQNQTYSSTAIFLGSVFIQEPQLIAFIIAMIAIPLVHLFLTRTYYGRAIRATAQDWSAAEFSGIDIRKTRLTSFALGSGLAGVAGGIFAFTNSVTPSLGDTSLLPIILVVIILGGVGSVIGTLIGGFAVGLLLNFSDLAVYGYLSQFGLQADFGYFITFLVFLIFLMLRPQGIFGKGVAQ